MPRIPFKEFLTEAKFSPNQVDKVLFNLKKLIERKIGQKLYRFGGENGYQVIQIKGHPGSAKGFLYFTPRRLAIRFNFVKGEFVSMNFWKSWSVGKPSDFYMDFGGANIVQITDIIIEKLKQGIKGEKLKEEIPVFIPESYSSYDNEMLEEARAPKFNPVTLYQMLVQTYPNKDMTKLHHTDISRAVAAHGLSSIPGFVKLNPVPGMRGYYNVVPKSDDDTEIPAGVKDDKIRYIKVTVQDPVSKKFLSSADDKIAQEMYQKIQGVISDNSAEMAQKEMKDPKTLFGSLAALTKLVVKNINKSLLIYGGPGTGKTHTVTEVIKEGGLVKNKDWFHIKGKVTTKSLYQTLFMHREKALIVFDDADSVFANEDSANILKAALDSYDERVISWISPQTQNVSRFTDSMKRELNKELDKRLAESPLDDDEIDEETGKPIKKKPLKFPSEFKYDGRIIFISNLPENKLDSAVLSRSFKIDMTLNDEQMFQRMEEVVDKLGGDELTREEKLDTLRILRKRNKLGLLTNPNMRTAVAAFKIRASGLPNWEDLLEYT